MGFTTIKLLQICNLRVPWLSGSGSHFFVGWKWFRCGLACYETPETRTLGAQVLILAVGGQSMYEDEQLSLANDCTAQWYGARLITRHALVQSLVGQERDSVRHEFVFASKGKNELESDTNSLLPGGRVGKSRYQQFCLKVHAASR